MHSGVLGFFFFADSTATTATADDASAFGEMRITLRVTIVIIISDYFDPQACASDTAAYSYHSFQHHPRAWIGTRNEAI